jgi:hypothetical protein
MSIWQRAKEVPNISLEASRDSGAAKIFYLKDTENLCPGLF